MQAEERQQTILQLLDARGQVTISDLSTRFGVSEMTVRRGPDRERQLRTAVRDAGPAQPRRETRHRR
jgi:DeoR/GlpR family transcriptional regulator of sugar metabolism